MASETLRTSKTWSGSYRASDSKGNEGYGSTEGKAIEALKMAQNKKNK
ncbi:hypothetical protein [Lyngbya sp. CCY1209]|nr:hypothetical protein [Lyngbya sp. CCY1209]MEB3883398.1 hypothetical protein [Lyngbya sp. CCY1209]